MAKPSSDSPHDLPPQSKMTTWVGVSLTIAYVVGMAIYVVLEWKHLLKMTPNEFGDFMAGAFGPLALFWLVCGYFQQGAELRQNTKALKMQSDALERQVDELERSVRHQEELVSATRGSLEFSVRESDARKEQQALLNSPRMAVSFFKPYTQTAPGLFEIHLRNEGAPAFILGVDSEECVPAVAKLSELGTGQFMSIQAMKDDVFNWPAEIKIVVRMRTQMNQVEEVLIAFKLDETSRKYSYSALSVQ